MMAKKLSVNVFLGWLIVLPFIVLKGRFEEPRVAVFLAGGFFLSLFWIWRTLKLKKGFNFSQPDYFFLLWILLLLLSGLWGVNPTGAILGGSYRHQGWLFFLTLWLIGKTLELLPGRSKDILKKWLGAAVIVQALIVILQVVLHNTYFGKPLGTLGEPNAVAGYLAIGSIYAFGFWPIIFPAVLLTGSRTGIAGYLLLFFLSQKKKLLVLGITILSVLVILNVFKQKSYSMFENRPLYWQMAASFIKEKPLLGWGAESQEFLYDREFARREMPLSGMMVDRTHNLILDVTIWSGVVGSIIFFGWLMMAGYSMKKNSKEFYALIAWLVFSMLQPLGVAHWILLQYILTFSKKVSGQIKHPTLNRAMEKSSAIGGIRLSASS
jgi:O-antigen ligase